MKPRLQCLFLRNTYAILEYICDVCNAFVCDCNFANNNYISISDSSTNYISNNSYNSFYDRDTIYDTSQNVCEDYYHATILAADTVSLSNQFDVNSLNINNGQTNLIDDDKSKYTRKDATNINDKFDIGSLNTCGLKRWTEYPEFQSY